MNPNLNIDQIEKSFFQKGNPLKKLVKVTRELLNADQVGILYGTNASKTRFLPTSDWDRGVADMFDGKGMRGMVLKCFGPSIVTMKNLSPVYFYKTDKSGERTDNDGVISYMLRTCADYYQKGISIIFSPDTRVDMSGDNPYADIPFYSYNGSFISEPDIRIKVDLRIIKHFYSKNYVSIYIPDYGILVANTIDPQLLDRIDDRFAREDELKQTFDTLIQLVEVASLAALGRLKGRRGAHLLWKKERQLRQTSQALVENEKKYRDLYENAPIAYFSVNAQGILIKCNNNTSKLSGYTKQELLGHHIFEFYAPISGEERTPEQVKKLIEQETSAKDVEMKFINKNQEEVWISLSFHAVKDSEGKISEIRAMAVDISGRKALEKQLLQAQKMEAIGTLAGGIAHDFNNILTPIAGYSEILLMDSDDSNPRKQEHLKIIHDCALYAKGLVNQMLTFSKQKESEFKVLQPHTFVKDALSLAKSFLPAIIKVQVRVNRECGLVEVDPIQAHQVLMNLISNAYHAMEKDGGTLSVTLDQVEVTKDDQIFTLKPGCYVFLKIEDTGPGIDPESLERIFDPFFTTKKEGKGSGIGLSVVHGIVQSHNGTINVDSKLGKGTCFDIYLPVYDGPAQVEPDGDDDIPIQTGTERILLVDDEETVALMEQHILEKLGYQVTCVFESPKAVELFENDPSQFDMVITDLTMPDLTGYQLSEKITQIRPNIPILLCTGFGEHLDKQEYNLKGVKGFLNKPVSVKDMSLLVRRVLDKEKE